MVICSNIYENIYYTKIKSTHSNEKRYLEPYINENEPTQYFSAEDGFAGGLIMAKVIFRSTNLGNMKDGFAFNIDPYAKKVLLKRPVHPASAYFAVKKNVEKSGFKVEIVSGF